MSKISFFKNIRNTTVPYVIDIDEALRWIKEGKYRETVDLVRYEAFKPKQDELKKELPLFLFSGVFKTRSIAGLESHSGFICLDFDKFKTKEEMAICKNELSKLDYIYAVFASPTDTGLKALVKIPPMAGKHSLYFEALANELAPKFPQFDLLTKDVSRACFVTYDLDAHINKDAVTWEAYEEPDLADLVTEEVLVPLKTASVIMKRLYSWWTSKYGLKKGERNHNCYVLAVALCEFGITLSEAKEFMSQLKDVDFHESEIIKVVENAYKQKAPSANTKFFEDTELREAIERDIVNGKTLPMLKKAYKDRLDDVEEVMDKISANIVIDQFWEINKKTGNIDILPHKFKKYLTSKYIFKYRTSDDAPTIFVRVVENKVRIITPDTIKDIVLKDLETREGIGVKPYNFMAKSTKYFTDAFLSLVDTIDISLLKDTRDEGFIYYKDSVVRVTKDSIDKIEYIDLDGFIWESRILSRNFELRSTENAVYRKFIKILAKNDETTFKSICSTIGYLLHSFKYRSKNVAVILNDEIISENPNGGSGKGLFTQGIEKMKRTSVIDGKFYDPQKEFNFQTVSPDTQILVLDDVKKNFPFETIFSLITEGITINKKNLAAIKLEVQESPKVLISTNYTIRGEGGSHERRKHELEFGSYFNAKHTPSDEFGHQLFDDWDEEEYYRFDSFMLECFQLYLREGLLACPQNNLALRKVINASSLDFVSFAEEDLKPNVRYTLAEIVEMFATVMGQKNFNYRAMSRWISVYAEYKGYEKRPSRVGNTRGFVLYTPEQPISDLLKSELGISSDKNQEDLPF